MWRQKNESKFNILAASVCVCDRRQCFADFLHCRLFCINQNGPRAYHTTGSSLLPLSDGFVVFSLLGPTRLFLQQRNHPSRCFDINYLSNGHMLDV